MEPTHLGPDDDDLAFCEEGHRYTPGPWIEEGGTLRDGRRWHRGPCGMPHYRESPFVFQRDDGEPKLSERAAALAGLGALLVLLVVVVILAWNP